MKTLASKNLCVWFLALSLCVAAGCPQSEFDECTPAPPVETHLRIMTYNVHLFDIAHILAAAGPLKVLLQDLVEFYLSKSGEKSIDYFDQLRLVEITNHLLALDPSPDVIVIDELWSDSLANTLVTKIKCRYPYEFRPDSHEDIFQGQFLGNGLLLLSKYPILKDSENFQPFNKLDGADAFSIKGIASTTLQIGEQSELAVFFTHTNAAGNDVTLDNFTQIAAEIGKFQKSHLKTGIVLAGDLNIAGDSPGYQKMMNIFGNEGLMFKDAYRQFHADSSVYPGYTFDTESNELLKIFLDGKYRERLDYILYIENGVLTGIHSATDSIKQEFYFFDPATETSLPLSDHYPIFVDFALQG